MGFSLAFKGANYSGTILGSAFSHTPKDDVSEEDGPWENLDEDGTKLCRGDVGLVQTRNWEAAARNRLGRKKKVGKVTARKRAEMSHKKIPASSRAV